MTPTNQSNGTTNASVEVLSEDGPMPINVMMQEGVKALTKILSNQLQDRQAFQNAPHAMQFVIRNGGKALSNARLEELKDALPKMDSLSLEDELAKIDGQSAYHIDSAEEKETFESKIGQIASRNSADFIIEEDLQNILDDDLKDSELNLDGEEAEIIFDYESQELDTPDGIGEKISQMIESVLPGGFGSEEQGGLRTVTNVEDLDVAKEVTDIDHDTVDAARLHGDGQHSISSRKHSRSKNSKKNGHVRRHDFYDESRDHKSCCPHHHYENLSKLRNYYYHDFEYISKTENRVPDFSVLVNESSPMCLFCEYYMVFGEPPRNMIKWYNRTFGYNRMPNPPRDEQDSRKRNR
ncbi:XXYS1_4_G0013170.mRNA.1.CDS.1 [Saccharomyces cerevisiae]|nr:EM14S01-3B_G0010520.mRNA.1.CDS.1 [Saccharomyces cerevisiae]CAD6644065.1 XXYS1_4_G0013170.mRNA.1.CDS.1 [Saccharomyces cerevisiae]CAI4729541.1 CEI_1a_G0044900.mRNA.1.CDS.1 [Saccharomyces cerevisiae]CAI4731809.1 AMH_1a_G0045000.mRNA.1.CDS.1 [Saccharomyces cerevisiae]CAI6857785.1 AMH_1a_G0045000.mRNA.1.CDS.1 [Saccharomyces cerevisiae]